MPVGAAAVVAVPPAVVAVVLLLLLELQATASIPPTAASETIFTINRARIPLPGSIGRNSRNTPCVPRFIGHAVELAAGARQADNPSFSTRL